MPSLPAPPYLTRDESGQVRGYVEGQPVFAFTDDTAQATFSEPDAAAYFFVDDVTTGGAEASGGLVRQIRVFDHALSAEEIFLLDGQSDAGQSDAGQSDAGPGDAGPGDAGAADAGLDGGPPDSGTLDAGLTDAGSAEPTPSTGCGCTELSSGALLLASALLLLAGRRLRPGP